MASLQKSTIVRFRNRLLRAWFRYAEYVAPRRAGRAARALWFTAPPRMADVVLPSGGAAFEVEAQGHPVRGFVWGAAAQPATTVYLVHGWGGRGAQFAAMVPPLVEAGHRVVMFDAPAHGDSDHGPAGPGRPTGWSSPRPWTPSSAGSDRPRPSSRTRWAPSRPTWRCATGGSGPSAWCSSRPWSSPSRCSTSSSGRSASVLASGPRSTRRSTSSSGSGARVRRPRPGSARRALPTLVITDRGDRQTAYADVVDFAESIGAPLVTTEDLGHRKILRDPAVVERVVDFVSAQDQAGPDGVAGVRRPNAATRRRGPCGGAAPGDVPGSPAGRVAA